MSYLIDFIISTYHFLIQSWGLTFALIGFILQKFFVPQILEYREIIKRARYDLIYYANIFPIKDKTGTIVNTNELDDIRKKLRDMASKIKAYRNNIPCYKAIAYTGLVPKFDNTEIIATNFMIWSNDIYEIDSKISARQELRKKIADALGMKYY
ncbi:hypothetical protein GYA19_03160 [Candidatus Beckwithbacteria bacterium]|nr:hypothetical protein [Candidatus Beckwithbacteria bacterium]